MGLRNNQYDIVKFSLKTQVMTQEAVLDNIFLFITCLYKNSPIGTSYLLVYSKMHAEFIICGIILYHMIGTISDSFRLQKTNIWINENKFRSLPGMMTT